MSFREVRNFIEILRTLGYRQTISLESFRQPNFHLVATIVVWLVKRFDADYNILDDWSTSEFRILLIRSITEFMLLKTGVKLNMKKLYQADGHAVKEMLKIASLLHKALKMKETLDAGFCSFSNIDLSAKIQELKLTRELALQITQKGSSLFELLSKEPALRESRLVQGNRYIDVKEVETLVRTSINETNKSIFQIKQQTENIASTENSLGAKISKKETDLERISKRLETLKSVRPAFLEEYERYEDELNQIYENYVIKFRCHTHLQQQLQLLLNINQLQTTAINTSTNDQDDTFDRMASLIDDGSLSSSSPPPAPTLSSKQLDMKKSIGGRIRTAVDSHISKTGNRMYGNVNDESEDFDDEDDDDDDDDQVHDEFLNGDSLLNNDSDDDSQSQHSCADNFIMNDDKSDDTF